MLQLLIAAGECGRRTADEQRKFTYAPLIVGVSRSQSASTNGRRMVPKVTDALAASPPCPLSRNAE